MKKNNGLKIILCTVIALLMASVIAYFIYECVSSGGIDKENALRAAVILLSCIATLIKLFSAPRVARLSPDTYRETYKDLIGQAFSEDKKLEARFFAALDKYNANDLAGAISALGKLADKCKRADERFTLSFFMALCYDELRAYKAAIPLYETALTFRENSTAASNLGICYQEIGDYKEALSAYEFAVRIDPDNAYPLNNIAQLYIRQGEYKKALEYAVKASELNERMYQSYTAQAICYAMLEDYENHKKAFERAVMCGANGEAIKKKLADLDCDFY